MKNVRDKIWAMQGQLEGLKSKRQDILYSGRDKAWQKRELDKATALTKTQIRKLQDEAFQGWLGEYAKARETKKNDNYQERSFYQQKFAAMLQGASPENIPELFRKIASDPETSKYKRDFLDLAEIQVDDESKPALETAKMEKMTAEEKAQQKQLDKVLTMKNQLTMLTNLAEETLIDDILKGNGKPSIDLTTVFDECLQKAEKTAGRKMGERPEDRPENQEQMRQMQESLQKSRVTSL